MTQSSRFQFYIFINDLGKDKEVQFISFVNNRKTQIIRTILKFLIEGTKKLKFNMDTCKGLHLVKRNITNYNKKDLALHSFYRTKSLTTK